MITTPFIQAIDTLLSELWLMPDRDQRKALAYVKARLASEQAYRSYQAADARIAELERMLAQATDRKVKAGVRMVAATDRAQQIKDRNARQALRDANPYGAYSKPDTGYLACECPICKPDAYPVTVNDQAPAYDDDGLPL